jgi:hypothetical protein
VRQFLALACLILAVAVLPSPTSSKIPNDNLIVPGHRIGRWTLEMTVDQFARTTGKPPDERSHHEIDFRSQLRQYCATEICAFYRAEETITFLRVTHITGSSKTERGVGIGSPLAAIMEAYGRPTAMTRLGDESGGFIRLIFDRIGLSFRVNLVTETTISISVFRPGHAATIWTF